MDGRTLCLYRWAMRCLGRANGRRRGALRFHRRTDCDCPGTDRRRVRTACYLRGALGRQRRTFRSCRWTRCGGGRADRDRCGAGGGQHLHDRHHRHGRFSRVPRVVERPLQSLVETGRVQPNKTGCFIRRKLGWAVIAALNIIPRALGAAGRLKPSLSIPLQIDEDVEKAVAEPC